jgi:hypothetical protein
MHNDADSAPAPLRARIRSLASQGVPERDIRQLCAADVIGVPLDAETFKQVFLNELLLGAAEANAEVSKALYAQAASGKVPTITLAWAKYRLGWNDEKEDEAHAAGVATDQYALETLQQLLDQLAAAKAGSNSGAALGRACLRTQGRPGHAGA